MTESNVEISVVICTLNRNDYLQKACESLTRQTLTRNRFEVVVIDNGISEETRQVVMAFADVLCIRYVPESQLGIARARNAGWLNARAPIVAYTDDDCIANENWLERILTTFETVQPTPGCVGGSVYPIWETPRSNWLSDNLLKYLSVITKEGDPRWVDRAFLVTANLAFRKEIFTEIGPFEPSIGHMGNHLLRGEDTLMVKRIIASGLGCYYDAGIRVGHHIVPSRLNRRWFIRRAFWGGVSNTMIEAHVQPLSRRQQLQKGLKMLALTFYPKHFHRLLLSPKCPESMSEVCKRTQTLGMAYGYFANPQRHLSS